MFIFVNGNRLASTFNKPFPFSSQSWNAKITTPIILPKSRPFLVEITVMASGLQEFLSESANL